MAEGRRATRFTRKAKRDAIKELMRAYAGAMPEPIERLVNWLTEELAKPSKKRGDEE